MFDVIPFLCTYKTQNDKSGIIRKVLEQLLLQHMHIFKRTLFHLKFQLIEKF